MPIPFAADRFLAMNPAVTVQLFNGTGTCWQSEFNDAYRNKGDGFKTKRKVVVVH